MPEEDGTETSQSAAAPSEFSSSADKEAATVTKSSKEGEKSNGGDNGNNDSNDDDDDGPEEPLDDIPDEDIDMYLHTPDQTKLKEKAWNEMHKDYLREKEEKELEDELNGKNTRKHHRKRTKISSENPADASSQALKNLAPSKKINREILGALFNMDEQALEKGPQHTSALDVHDGDFASSFYADELIGGMPPPSSRTSTSAGPGMSLLNRARMGQTETGKMRSRKEDAASGDDNDEDDYNNEDDGGDDDEEDDGGYYGTGGAGGGGGGYDDDDDGRGNNGYDDDENYF